MFIMFKHQHVYSLIFDHDLMPDGDAQFRWNRNLGAATAGSPQPGLQPWHLMLWPAAQTTCMPREHKSHHSSLRYY